VYPRVNKVQLFDLRADPAETKDLSTSPEQAAEVQRLLARLKEEQQAAGDELPLTSDQPLPLEFDFTKVKRNPKAASGE
jgi:arylsulfatase A-like enzyme